MVDRRMPRMSRRALLGSSLLAVPLGAAAAVVLGPGPATAQPKVAQKLVQYQETPKGQQKCSNCLHFVAPDGCKLVEGKIKAEGWCSLYALKPN